MEAETASLVTESTPKLPKPTGTPGCEFMCAMEHSSPWAQPRTVAILIFCNFTAPSSSRSQGTLMLVHLVSWSPKGYANIKIKQHHKDNGRV